MKPLRIMQFYIMISKMKIKQDRLESDWIVSFWTLFMNTDQNWDSKFWVTSLEGALNDPEGQMNRSRSKAFYANAWDRDKHECRSREERKKQRRKRKVWLVFSGE